MIHKLFSENESSGVTYHCIRCNASHDSYVPYCSQCGAKQPDPNRAYANAATVRHMIDGVTDVQAELLRWRGCMVRLWRYRVSHGQLEFRLKQPDGYNTVILCDDTRSIILPTTFSWNATLIVEEQGQDADRIQILKDDSAGIAITCRSVVLYLDEKPGL
jgi:hypothetical protein